MTAVLQDRLERFLAPNIHLRSGSGNGINGDFDACVMQAVDWLAGGDGKTDSPECAARSITRFCIRLNDSPLFAEHRDLLKPYAAKIVGTRGPWQNEVQRAYIAADFAVRTAAPMWFRALSTIVKPELKAQFEDFAARCEGVAPIRDAATANAARGVANEVRRAADAAAYAAADAAASAYADAYAYAAADAAAYAAASAYAAADAAAAAAAAAAAYAAADAAASAYAAAAAAAYAAADADAAAAAAAAAYAYAAADADAPADAYAAAYAAADAYADAARKKVYASHGDQLRAAALKCLDDLIAVGSAVA